MNTFLAKAFLLLFLIPGWLTYTDSAKKFTISYPKDWTTRNLNGYDKTGTAILNSFAFFK